MLHPNLALFALTFIVSAEPGAALRLPPAIELQAFSLLCSEPEVAQERIYARHELLAFFFLEFVNYSLYRAAHIKAGGGLRRTPTPTGRKPLPANSSE